MYTCRRAPGLFVEGLQVYLYKGSRFKKRNMFTCRRATCLLVGGLQVYLRRRATYL